ncbi:hypothetical protein BG58_14315 [Caballeronia jiangsuensis]|nr:hypothetical protein BG58_14315 [Caballeronia jiangsuensis]
MPRGVALRGMVYQPMLRAEFSICSAPSWRAFFWSGLRAKPAFGLFFVSFGFDRRMLGINAELNLYARHE